MRSWFMIFVFDFSIPEHEAEQIQFLCLGDILLEIIKTNLTFLQPSVKCSCSCTATGER